MNRKKTFLLICKLSFGISLLFCTIFFSACLDATVNASCNGDNVSCSNSGNANSGNDSSTSTVSIQQSSSKSSVVINFPTGGSQVYQTITARGTALNIPQDKELWLVVQTSGTQDFYPQTDSTSDNSTGVTVNGGQWSIQIRIGSDTDNGVIFNVIAVLADQGGVRNIQQYFANASATGKFSPLHDLDGMTEQAIVQVKRFP